MLLLALVIAAALLLTLIFARGAGECPKSCHGCGKCHKTTEDGQSDQRP